MSIDDDVLTAGSPVSLVEWSVLIKILDDFRSRKQVDLCLTSLLVFTQSPSGELHLGRKGCSIWREIVTDSAHSGQDSQQLMPKSTNNVATLTKLTRAFEITLDDALLLCRGKWWPLWLKEVLVYLKPTAHLELLFEKNTWNMPRVWIR